MARYRRKTYTSRRKKKFSLRNIIIIAVIIAAGGLIFWRLKSRPAPQQASANEDTRTVVLPEDEPELTPSGNVFNPRPEERPDEQVRTEIEIQTPQETIVDEPEESKEQEPEKTIAVLDPPEETPAAEAAATAGEAGTLILEAREDMTDGNIIDAREKLNEALTLQVSPIDAKLIKKILAKLSDKWLFSSDVYEDDRLTGWYLVQPGDRLTEIGDKFNVPYRILQDINNIARPELLQAGVKIKVIYGPFNAIVHKSDFTMDLYLKNKTYIKTYKIGLGDKETETPTGRWRVRKGGKLIKPNWTDPRTGTTYIASHPEYPLGSRWISLEGIEGDALDRRGFAIHGTKDPETIGTRSSMGCIRLHNGDVIEVFNLLQDGASEVRVVE